MSGHLTSDTVAQVYVRERGWLKLPTARSLVADVGKWLQGKGLPWSMR